MPNDFPSVEGNLSLCSGLISTPKNATKAVSESSDINFKQNNFPG